MSLSISGDTWLVMGALTVFSIILGFLPYIIIHKTKLAVKRNSYTYKLVLTILSCFGGGVLLSTSALHMLPEVRESLTDIPQIWESFDDHFPVAEMLMLSGFALIYLVEEIAHFIMVEGTHHHHHDSVARHNSIAHAIPLPNSRGSFLNTSEEDINTLEAVKVDKLGDGMSDESKEEDESHNHHFSSSIRSFLALIALSFHAIMEGIAVGIQNSTDMWLLFGAVASHKFVISFCMGMELVATHAKIRTYIGSIVVFAILSPVGILIGSALTSADSKNLTVVVIEGLATGTLFYVVFFEILNRERERKTFCMKNSKAVGFIQFAAILVGLVAMGFLLTLGDHAHGDADHGHEEECDHEPHLQASKSLKYPPAISHLASVINATAQSNVMKNFPVAFGR